MKTRKILAIALITIMFLAAFIVVVNAATSAGFTALVTTETYTVGQEGTDKSENQSVDEGKTLQLKAYINQKTVTTPPLTPDGPAGDTEVTNRIVAEATPTWTSSDTSVATISSTGLVTGKKAGTTRITVTDTYLDQDVTTEITLTVNKANFYDFSNAKIEMTKEMTLFYDAKIAVTGIDSAKVSAYKDENKCSFFLFISDKTNATLPATRSEAYDLSVDNNNPTLPVVCELTLKDDNTMEISSRTWCDEIYSLKGDTLYGTILESYTEPGTLTTKLHPSKRDIKFTKPAQEAYGNKIKFSLYEEWTYMAVNEPSSSNQKRMLMQVAKVNDISKYTDENKYTKLMEDLKNTKEFVYNSEITFNRGGAGGTNASNKELLTSKLKLEPKAYYFIYAKLLDEDGKYKEVEDIELYQAIGKEGIMSLIAVKGFDREPSEDDGNVIPTNTTTTNPTNATGDPTIAKKTIPQTGATPVFMIVLGSVILIAGVFVVANKKYKDIK